MFKVLLISVMVLAARDHGSHEHGAGRVSIGFDGRKGRIEMEIPAETLFGFEHEAKSKKDKQKKEEALKNLEEKITEMIVFDPALKCEVRKDIFEVSQSKNHADVEADFTVSCDKAVAESTVSFHFEKVFSRFKKVQVDFITDGVQKSLQVLKNGDSLELK
ncbi:MAG: DUF2796 domain-containing protein [Bdellovibrio sp.]|nr:DUF2796 domain-containing protein [Bdellovibrio sp.]